MARLDTGWHANPKVLGVGLTAMGLHAWSISYCDFALSDGFLPRGAWPALPGVRGAVQALLTAGLWEETEGGYRLHDYTKYNRTRSQVTAEQEASNERVRAYRKRRGNGVTEGGSNGVSLARAGAPGPGPGPVGTGPSYTPLPPVPERAADGPAARGAPERGYDEDEITQRRTSKPGASPSEAAIATMYGPRQTVERLPNGAQQCPLCPVIFTGSYSDHLSERHKVRDEPDDLSGFHG